MGAGGALTGQPLVDPTFETLSGDRDRWIARLEHHAHALWPELGRSCEIRLAARTARRGANCIIFGYARGRRERVPLCIKFTPGAEPGDIERTDRRLGWWRDRHPEQASGTPRILAAWPMERVLVMTRAPGRPLRRRRMGVSRFRFPGAPGHAHCRRLGHSIGEWLRSFAEGEPPYDREVDPLLGRLARLNALGRFSVDARRLLENRIESGHRAAAALQRAGFRRTTSWNERFDVDAIVRSVGEFEPGGFVHGDVKPENLLVHRDGFTLVDWWTTPRVSWPLTDLGNFAGNLRHWNDRAAAAGLWHAVLSGYFETSPDESTLAIIDLISTILCLTHAAAKLSRNTTRLPRLGRLNGLIPSTLRAGLGPAPWMGTAR